MLPLKIRIETENITVDQKIKDSFSDPLVFYLLNKKAFYLCSFVIVDFQNNQIKYIETYSDSNISAVKENYGEEILKDPPHSIMAIDKNKLLNMVYSVRSGMNNTLRLIDLEKEEMQIHSSEDFGYNDLGRVSETGTKDPDDPSWFYICFLKKDGESSNYYKISVDLTKSEFLFNDNGIFKRPPHQIIRCGNFILSSGFGEDEGQILSYNMKTKEISVIPTIVKPSHLEARDGIVYYASNNMKLEGTSVVFTGPARIGKLKVSNEVVKGSEFWNESGFRFTSHKILDSDTLVTVGFPNRLFFIDSATMKLSFYHDVDKNIIPDHDQLNFLNKDYKQTLDDPYRYTALETSNDGKYVVFFNQKEIRFFNRNLREIECEIPYKIKEQYFQLSHHCDFLK